MEFILLFVSVWLISGASAAGSIWEWITRRWVENAARLGLEPRTRRLSDGRIAPILRGDIDAHAVELYPTEHHRLACRVRLSIPLYMGLSVGFEPGDPSGSELEAELTSGAGDLHRRWVSRVTHFAAGDVPAARRLVQGLGPFVDELAALGYAVAIDEECITLTRRRSSSHSRISRLVKAAVAFAKDVDTEARDHAHPRSVEVERGIEELTQVARLRGLSTVHRPIAVEGVLMGRPLNLAFAFAPGDARPTVRVTVELPKHLIGRVLIHEVDGPPSDPLECALPTVEPEGGHALNAECKEGDERLAIRAERVRSFEALINADTAAAIRALPRFDCLRFEGRELTFSVAAEHVTIVQTLDALDQLARAMQDRPQLSTSIYRQLAKAS